MFETALIVIFSALVGGVLGILAFAVTVKRKLRAELDKEKAEFEQTKTDLAHSLGGELGKIRDSIVQSVQAYESAVKTVSEKLPAFEGLKNRQIEYKDEPKQLELKDIAKQEPDLWGKPTDKVANDDDAGADRFELGVANSAETLTDLVSRAGN